jgi:DNA-binding transcriptional ArsR family regulator
MPSATAQVFGSAIDADTCDVSCLHPDAIRPVLGRSLSPEGATTVAALFGVLADPSRARIVHLLAIADDLCVCDMALVLGMSVSALSHQLRFLRERGLVTRNKVGRMAYYRLEDARMGRLVLDAAAHAAETAA